MNFKTKLSHLVSQINSGFKHRTMEIKHIYNKDLNKILGLLLKEGIILGYSVLGSPKYFLIQLKFTTWSVGNTSKLSIKSKVPLPRFISEYELNSLKYKNSRTLRITSTNEGLVVNEQGKTKGGEFILEIS